MTTPEISKATPSADYEASGAVHPCLVCGRDIKRVPGGQGPVWIHVDSGVVCASPKSDPPPQPYHRWRMNEDPDFEHLRGDYCLACGVKRFPGDHQPTQIAKAQGPCPGERD
jgi:hypothetical protein